MMRTFRVLAEESEAFIGVAVNAAGGVTDGRTHWLGSTDCPRAPELVVANRFRQTNTERAVFTQEV